MLGQAGSPRVAGKKQLSRPIPAVPANSRLGQLYYATLERFANIAPTDIVTWLLIKDLVDYRVEIARYRRLKAAIVELAHHRRINAVIEYQRSKLDFDLALLRAEEGAERNNCAPSLMTKSGSIRIARGSRKNTRKKPPRRDGSYDHISRLDHTPRQCGPPSGNRGEKIRRDAAGTERHIFSQGAGAPWRRTDIYAALDCSH